MTKPRLYRPNTRPVLQQMIQFQWGRCPHRCREVPHREQAFTEPSSPHLRTTLSSLQDHRSPNFWETMPEKHFKTTESIFQPLQDHWVFVLTISRPWSLRTLKELVFNHFKTFLSECDTPDFHKVQPCWQSRQRFKESVSLTQEDRRHKHSRWSSETDENSEKF